MELFEDIRRARREEGLAIRELARRHHVHRRTVRQALQSALPPPRRQAPHAPKLGPYVDLVREWLVADLGAPRKQRHTARRAWERLVDEYGTTVAESTARGCVARLRRELESGRVEVTIPQVHPPGEEAEVDFGEVTVGWRGRRRAGAPWRDPRARTAASGAHPLLAHHSRSYSTRPE